MKDEAIKLISDETGDEHFKADDIQWVLTVPAIWTPSAKQFMRESAYEVKFALPERRTSSNTLVIVVLKIVMIMTAGIIINLIS